MPAWAVSPTVCWPADTWRLPEPPLPTPLATVVPSIVRSNVPPSLAGLTTLWTVSVWVMVCDCSTVTLACDCDVTVASPEWPMAVPVFVVEAVRVWVQV